MGERVYVIVLENVLRDIEDNCITPYRLIFVKMIITNFTGLIFDI